MTGAWDAWGLEIDGFLYEGSGKSATVYHTNDTRSFGIQVDTILNIKGKVKRSSGGGTTNHKPDCKCCVYVQQRPLHEAGVEHALDLVRELVRIVERAAVVLAVVLGRPFVQRDLVRGSRGASTRALARALCAGVAAAGELRSPPGR